MFFTTSKVFVCFATLSVESLRADSGTPPDALAAAGAAESVTPPATPPFAKPTVVPAGDGFYTKWSNKVAKALRAKSKISMKPSTWVPTGLTRLKKNLTSKLLIYNY